MSDSNSAPVTTWTTLCAILLREARVERNFHQAQVADIIDKSTSSWTKVEAGQSPLQLETLFRVCAFLGAAPSDVTRAAEHYADVLRQHGWVILFNLPDGIKKDPLMEMAQSYWNSPGGKIAIRTFPFNSILNVYRSGVDVNSNIPPVFGYALFSDFRELQDTPLLLDSGSLNFRL